MFQSFIDQQVEIGPVIRPPLLSSRVLPAQDDKRNPDTASEINLNRVVPLARFRTFGSAHEPKEPGISNKRETWINWCCGICFLQPSVFFQAETACSRLCVCTVGKDGYKKLKPLKFTLFDDPCRKEQTNSFFQNLQSFFIYCRKIPPTSNQTVTTMCLMPDRFSPEDSWDLPLLLSLWAPLHF